MNRLLLVFVLAACPAAQAQQDDPVEGQKLAAAFTQVDLDALGRCHARVEGAGLILQDMESWLVAEKQTGVLDALRNQIQRGEDVLQRLGEVRDLTATAKGMNLAGASTAREQMLETFKRRPGEDERAFYARAQPETKLPPECGVALNRGRWKIEIDELG